MLCEKIIGNLNDYEKGNRAIEYIDIDWHEAFQRIHKKTTKEGTEVGIRLDHNVLTTGLKENDILYADDQKIIAVHIPPCEVIVATVDSHHPHMVAKLCYEVGNRHSTLFWGDDHSTFIIPYNEPMLPMIQKIHGVTAKIETLSLDFNKAISSSINAHTH